MSFKKKWNKLLHDALSLTVAELEAVKNRFQEVKDCNTHAQIHWFQIKLRNPVCLHWVNPLQPGGVSFFPFSCGLSTGETQIMNLKAETSTFSSSQACKHVDKKQKSVTPRNSSDINFHMAPSQLEFCTATYIFVQVSYLPLTWNNWDKIWSLTSGLYHTSKNPKFLFKCFSNWNFVVSSCLQCLFE